MTTIATLKALLTMDTSDFTSGAKKASADAEGLGGGLLSGAGKFVAFGVAAAAAAVPVAMFLKGAIDAAEQMGKVTGETERVIQTTGGAAGVTASHVKSLAESVSNYSGVSQEAVGHTENLLLTFTNIKNQVGKGNDVFDQATKLSLDMATALGTDASGAAIQLGKALNDPVKGITALQRSGVSFTAQQKEQIKTLTESGHSLEAQKIILAELSKEFGGAAATAATPMEKLQNTIHNLQISLGEKLLPIVNSVVGVIGSVLPTVVDIASGAFDSLASLIGGVFGPVFGEFQGGVMALGAAWADFNDGVTSSGFAGWMESLGITARQVFEGIKDAWSLLTTGTTTDELETNLGSLGPKIKEVADIIRNFVSQVPGWFNQAKDAVTNFVTAAAPFWEAIKGNQNLLIVAGILIGYTLVSAFIALAAAAWSAAAGVIAATWPFLLIVAVIFAVVAALRYAYENWEWFRNGVNAVVSWLVANVPPAFEMLKAGIAVVVDWITTVAVPFITMAFTAFMGFLQGTLLPAVTNVWNGIQNVIATVIDIVMAIVARVSAFISDNWNWIAGLASAIWDQISNVISNAWQIISNIIQLFLNIISGNWGAAWDNIKNIVSAVTNMVIGTVENTARALGNAFMLIVSFAGNMAGGLLERLGDIVSFFQGLPGRILGAIGNLGSLLFNAGKDILQGLLNGLQSMIGALQEKLGFITKLIPLGKGPPVVDRKLLEPAGSMIMTGLVGGIIAGIPALQAQLAAVTAIIRGTAAGNGISAGISGGIGPGVAAGISGSQRGALGSQAASAAGAAMTVIVNGRARSEDGVAVVNALTAWERVGGTTWRTGARELTASGW